MDSLEHVVKMTAGDPNVAAIDHTRVQGIKMHQRPGSRNQSLRDAVRDDTSIPKEFQEAFHDILEENKTDETKKWLLWEVTIRLGKIELSYVDWENVILTHVVVTDPSDIGLVFTEPRTEPRKKPAVCECRMTHGRMELKLTKDDEVKARMVSLSY